MNTYSHNGEKLPTELIDRIADDVRTFDQAQRPEQRAVKNLAAIAEQLVHVRMQLRKASDRQEAASHVALRTAVALEVQAALALGVPAAAIRPLVPSAVYAGSSLLTEALLQQAEQGDAS